MTEDTITAIKKALETLKQQKSMSMFANQGDMISDLLEERKLAASALESLQRENDELQRVNKRLLGEATLNSMEARGANSTIAEIYQIISGARGEPGNWNGAEPVRKYVDAAEAKVKRLTYLLEKVAPPQFFKSWLPPHDYEMIRAALSSTGDTHGN